MAKKPQIKCGGGLFFLGDGSFAYFVELHLLDSVFHFESLETWEHEAEAESALTRCISAFPQVIATAANTKDPDLVDIFCDKQKIVKVIPPKNEPPPQVTDEPEGEPGNMH